MDSETKALLRRLVEEDQTSFLFPRPSGWGPGWGWAILERRESIEDTARMEKFWDWRRAFDGEHDAIYVRDLADVKMSYQRDALEGIREGTIVMAAGIQAPEAAIEAGEVDEELYRELGGLEISPDLVPEGDDYQRALDLAQGIEVDPVEESSQPPPGEKLPAALTEWCEAADVQLSSAEDHSREGEEALWCVEIDADDLCEAWQRLHATREGTAHYPLVTKPTSKTPRLSDGLGNLLDASRNHSRPMDEWLSAADRIDVDEWVDAYIEREGAEGLGPGYFEVESFEPEPPSNPKPTSDRLHPIAFVPVEEGWQVPAFFNYGGYNAQPMPEYQCAMLERWNQRWGGELMSMTLSTVELYLEDPIREADTALQIAREHFTYCPSVPEQNITRFAHPVYGSHVWLFWWD